MLFDYSHQPTCAQDIKVTLLWLQLGGAAPAVGKPSASSEANGVSAPVRSDAGAYQTALQTAKDCDCSDVRAVIAQGANKLYILRCQGGTDWSNIWRIKQPLDVRGYNVIEQFGPEAALGKRAVDEARNRTRRIPATFPSPTCFSSLQVPHQRPIGSV